jgi:hypothetical protein
VLRLSGYRKKEVAMVLFLLGLIIGGVLGIASLAVLSSGANADEQMQHMMKGSVNPLMDKQKVIIHKN